MTSQLAGMSKQQLYDLLSQMKVSTLMPISVTQNCCKHLHDLLHPSYLHPVSMQGGVGWSWQVLIQTNHAQARAILVANPQLTKGLFQVTLMPPTEMQQR